MMASRMSKAFTKDDDAGEAPLLSPRRPTLPAGVPNYVTPRGLLQLQAELAAELKRELPNTVAETERARAHALRTTRLAELESRIASAVVVHSEQQPRDEARFGAEITVRNRSGVVRSYRIVGIDEADAGRSSLAFVAPLARALLGKRVGDVALVATPAGEDELEVLAIRYD
jgi:transcription elongation factor GreB